MLENFRKEKMGRIVPDNETIAKLAADLDSKFHVLDSETTSRLSDYATLIDYYNGNQRQYRSPDPGRFNLEWNLCAPTIDTFAALTFGEMVKITSVPDWETNVVEDVQAVKGEVEETEYIKEYNRSEFITKKLKDVFNEDTHVQFLRAEHNSSKLGVGVIQWGWNKSKIRPFFASLYPGFCRFAWKSQDFSELDYVFISVPMSVNAFRQKFGVDPTKEELQWSNTIPEVAHEAFNDLNRVPKVLVQYYYDDQLKIIKVGSRIIPQEDDLVTHHRYGTVPVMLFLTKPSDDKPLGDSDIRDGIKIQKDINSTLSGWFDISNTDEGTKIIVPGGNQQTMQALAKRGTVVVGSNREGPQPYILARSGQHPDLQARLSFLRDAFFQTVGMAQSFTAAPDTSVITQVGINALNTPTILRLKPRIAQRMSELKKVVKNVLMMYENFGGKIENTNLTYKDMISGHYEVEIAFRDITPRDDSVKVQMELFKLDRRVQSRAQTMENLGIENPLEELEQIAFEENNPLYQNPQVRNDERRLELAEEANQPKREAQEIEADAQRENQVLQSGSPVPVRETTEREHEIHLAVHSQVGQQVSQAVQANPNDPTTQAILQVFDDHIRQHETKLNVLRNKQGGVGQGSFGGRPAQEGAFNPPTAQGTQLRV